MRELGFAGAIAPFFLKRVFHAELLPRRAVKSAKRLIQFLTDPLRRVLSKIHGPQVVVELQCCNSCSFVQTKFPFADDAIGRLYADYRSDSYNRERSRFEPDYLRVQSQVGGYTENGLERIDALTGWLTAKASLSPATLLDYGGADGRFLPLLSGKKFVFEVSDVAPADGVSRVADESMLTTYDYVQIAHVLEHVTHPLHLAQRVASFVSPGGYLLIEVPQDVDLATMEAMRSGSWRGRIMIHEHINLYNALAVEKLIAAIGLEPVAVEAVPIIGPLTRQFFIRGLARKPLA